MVLTSRMIYWHSSHDNPSVAGCPNSGMALDVAGGGCQMCNSSWFCMTPTTWRAFASIDRAFFGLYLCCLCKYVNTSLTNTINLHRPHVINGISLEITNGLMSAIAILDAYVAVL